MIIQRNIQDVILECCTTCNSYDSEIRFDFKDLVKYGQTNFKELSSFIKNSEEGLQAYFAEREWKLDPNNKEKMLICRKYREEAIEKRARIYFNLVN